MLSHHATYRALELGPLAAATLNNIVEADLCAAKLFGFAGRRTRGVIAAAVSVHAVMQIVAVRLRTRAAVPAGPRTGCLAAGARRGTATLSDAAGRHTAASRAPRAGPRVLLTLWLGAVDGIPIWHVVGLCGGPICDRSMLWARSSRIVANTHVDGGVLAKVLVAPDDGVALLVFETDAGAGCGGRVQAVEILDSGDDGLSGVVGVNLYTHRYARAILMRVLDQFELDVASDGWGVLGLCELHDGGGIAAH